ncbi:MAG: hypothetical protein IJ590_03225 [Rickettsiales bacterium]|nr:hypothetical protein [Rickettsiales bacterium]
MKKIVFIGLFTLFFYPQNDTSKIAKAWTPTQRACYDHCKMQGKCIHMTGQELKSCKSNCAYKCD